jgi:uncharacterized protein (TIGR00369 family)
MSHPNRLARVVAKLSALPGALRGPAITLAFGSQVRFVLTGGVRFESLEEGRAVLAIRNRRKVQNHIGGVHAAAMALLAETATGAVFGMTIPDTHVPLLKSMHINYVRRAKGALRAEATLNAEQRNHILNEEKGDLTVPVRVTDEAGEEPIQCQFVWAWVPKKR